MKTQILLLLVVSSWLCMTDGASLERAETGSSKRHARDVVDAAKSIYETVAKGTKAVFNDMIGNHHVAVESYRQASDASQRVGPAVSGIFVNPNKVEQQPGPPPKQTADWDT